MTVSDHTEIAEVSGDFFRNLGKKAKNVSKRMAKNVLFNPRRALDIAANVANAFVYENAKAPLSTSHEKITFYHTGKGLTLGILFDFAM